MGQEEEATQRLIDFAGYQINDELVSHAKPDYMFLHCLPAHREEEVATSVIDGPNSYVFEQAENRSTCSKGSLSFTTRLSWKEVLIALPRKRSDRGKRKTFHAQKAVLASLLG